jgi:cytochrome b561
MGGLIAGAATQLPMGSVRLPGPGAFPVAIGIFLMALAVALLFQVKRAAETEPPPADTDEPEPWGHARVALVCALVTGFVFALPFVGFLTSSIVLMTALYVIGTGRLGVGPVAAGVGTALAAYVLFVSVLDVPLPGGSLWGG